MGKKKTKDSSVGAISKMKIISIDTSCDETSVAITEKTKILSNVIWSQASLHAKFGGVYPSLAKREHEKRIDWVIDQAIKKSGSKRQDLDAVAVTTGPGLAIALEVGIRSAKTISEKLNIPFISVNHIEGHVLSPLAIPKTGKKEKENIRFPALGLVTSGGHTQIILVKKVGSYKILASTVDDALGEALDKAARMLGLGYPGGPIMERFAREGSNKAYELPTPLIGQEERMVFSYSGLKTALYRKIHEVSGGTDNLNKKQTEDFAATFQNIAFRHFIRVFEWMIINNKIYQAKDVLAGGGVMANLLLRKKLRDLSKKYFLKIHFPYTKKLYGDNAGMIGIAAYFKAQRKEFEKNLSKVDRTPNAKIDKPFTWE